MLKLISDRSSGIEQLSYLVGLWLSELMYMYICVCVYMCVNSEYYAEWMKKQALCVENSVGGPPLEVGILSPAFYFLFTRLFISTSLLKQTSLNESR